MDDSKQRYLNRKDEEFFGSEERKGLLFPSSDVMDAAQDTLEMPFVASRENEHPAGDGTGTVGDGDVENDNGRQPQRFSAKEESLKPYKAKPVKKGYETRWVIVSTETGKVLDDAQGYGYRSAQNAYRGYGYKSKPKKEKRCLKEEQKAAERFWRKNRKLDEDIETMAFYAMKDGESFKQKDIADYIKVSGVDTGTLGVQKVAKYWLKR